MRDFAVRARYLDFFVACHPLMIIYFIAVVLREEAAARRLPAASLDEYFAAYEDGFPFEKEDCVRYFGQAIDLFRQHPPAAVLQEAPVGAVSRISEILIEDGGFSYPYPHFPIASSIPRGLYVAKLSPSVRPSFVKQILSSFWRGVGRIDIAQELIEA
jgi:hypothetical protein